MKVTGGATLHAPIDAVWAALNDPAVLVQAIPGCERLTATAPDTYELTVTAGVGTITGTYTGQISLTGQQPPSAFLLTADGAGAPGTVSTSVQIRLAAGGGATQLTYDADATIGGLIAGVGQRMLAGVAKRQATQFFAALDELLLSQLRDGAGAAGPGAVMAGAAPPGAEVGQAPGLGVTPGAAEPPQAGSPAAQPAQGRHAAGAAGVSPAADAATGGASGMTWVRPTAPGQPAGRGGAGPPSASFLQGAVVGAAIALAGVIVGGLISRRKH